MQDASADPAASGSNRRLRILVVEDDSELREVLAEVLEAHGFRAVTATNGREGLRQIRAYEPDVVVLDLCMPLMDGWQFRLEQKRDPSIASIPVIAMSASDSAAAATIDTDLYVKKPFTPEQMVEAIDNVLLTQQRKQEVVENAQTERLIALGTLAAGMAHEINNPLTYVFLNITGAMRQLAAVDRTHDKDRTALGLADCMLRDALEGSERIRGIVSGIRLFSRAENGPVTAVDVRACLEASLRLVMNDLRVRARLYAQYESTPHVLADEGRLGQVFLNLLTNAIQAIEEGAPERNQIRVSAYTDDLGRAVVEVGDSGSGIPEHLRSRIFEPFFTTKAVGKGTGLGLSISHGIVRSLGGEIVCESVVGQGTTFRVTLPRAAASVLAPEAPAVTPAARPLSILVVDDEPAIGEALRNALPRGHDIAIAASAREAIDRFDAREHFDVVLCDVQMPGMSGVELYKHARGAWPKIARAIVFMTGGTVTPEARALLDADGRTILEKPLDLDRLQALLSALPR
jgi:signal transduction histidine kinase